MKRSDLNHLRRLVAWRHQSRHLGGALNPSAGTFISAARAVS